MLASNSSMRALWLPEITDRPIIICLQIGGGSLPNLRFFKAMRILLHEAAGGRCVVSATNHRVSEFQYRIHTINRSNINNTTTIRSTETFRHNCNDIEYSNSNKKDQEWSLRLW